MSSSIVSKNVFEISPLIWGVSLGSASLSSLLNLAVLTDFFSPAANRNDVEKSKPWLAPAELPQITIQIPCRNEPLDVVQNGSLKSALALNYPKDKLTIQLVDNSEQGKYEELAAYCEEQGVHFIHREGRDGGKARNLNIGLGLWPVNGQRYEPQSDLYFLVDADITFEPDTLQKLLPEFKANPRLPFVVCEAESSGGNLFTDAIAATHLPRLYRRTNTEKYGFANSTGFGLLYNRHAWSEIQGWPEDSISEDWAASMTIRARSEYWTKGHRVNYVRLSDPVPANLERYKIQQARWVQGTLENIRWYLWPLLKAKHIPWNEKVDVFFKAWGYPQQAMAQVIIPLITVSSGISVIDNYLLLNNASAWLQSLSSVVSLFIIPFVLLAGVPIVFLKIKQGSESAGHYFRHLLTGSLAGISAGLAITRGVGKGLFGAKNALFNVTPKGNVPQENALLRTFQKNWKEIAFGSGIVLSSIFLLPGYLGLVSFFGLGFIITPFMSLIKFKKSEKTDFPKQQETQADKPHDM
ncbi:glycosyl transferase GTA-type super family [Candidatus Termititenax persephonae]|uniref:Glycosyl transferase GTA-type super family n=1 Tax=Candidatus Termititenax persephonae TaxID=2218525 RepID=A0A388TF21_9BACT|nr:glycosyl transferase GTA-type super family [Candidatus Termititenax persephonae]